MEYLKINPFGKTGKKILFSKKKENFSNKYKHNLR